MKIKPLYSEVSGIYTPFVPGVSLSEQLREERKIIEESATDYQKKKAKVLESDRKQGITPVTIKLPIDMAARFRKLAQIQGIPQRELFRRALTKYFKDFEDIK